LDLEPVDFNPPTVDAIVSKRSRVFEVKHEPIKAPERQTIICHSKGRHHCAEVQLEVSCPAGITMSVIGLGAKGFGIRAKGSFPVPDPTYASAKVFDQVGSNQHPEAPCFQGEGLLDANDFRRLKSSAFAKVVNQIAQRITFLGADLQLGVVGHDFVEDIPADFRRDVVLCLLNGDVDQALGTLMEQVASVKLVRACAAAVLKR
jgi:hypothetical protein